MSKTTAQKFGENMKRIRLEKGMSQGDICRALDLDRAYISNVENGKQNLTISTMEKVAKALDVSIDQLLK
ncbi:MAG: DNA-binding protein [Candidatus Levybacteria bacterium CG10_big_fil_rev_8_21_14_0_10_36_7]|nr:MAG: DNA-binding protein [Candidatus Levybacteria bacterium CG10_big_fil_rev_8_21_14_0_10_36_7]